MEMTIENTGRAGVELAIADGMRAADLERENAVLRADLTIERQRSAEIADQLKKTQKELRHAQRINRAYRDARSEAYKAVIDHQVNGHSRKDVRRLYMCLAFTGGVILAIACTSLALMLA